jgi:hypothetical protein
MSNSEKKEEDIYRFYFILGILFLAIGAAVTAAIDGPFGLIGLVFTIAGFIFLIIGLKNKDKWANEPAPEN